jgi:EAL domain-containing protein (putative c-di-GMP-specific phosphodiesterase class I)/FixJ family two-component response regulator
LIKACDQKKHILIIEDDPAISQMLRILLETRGYHIHSVRSSKEAFLSISKHIDLVLLDLMLPGEDGFDVCRKLKRSKESSHIPIIMVSAKALSKDIVEGLYLGADDFLIKPFEYDELVARMEAVMRRGNGHSFSHHRSYSEEDVVTELRQIIDTELFTPAFQPIYNLNDFSILGLEVLCRLTTKNRYITDPELLFKYAVKYGFYENLELTIWKKAIDCAWPHLREEKLFLNCNPYLVEGEKFIEIKALFDGRTIKKENVVLEITERSAIGEYKVFYENLTKFRNVGFKFAVDDVGGGYASLESIVETKPEIVKIDRHITQDIDKDPFKRSIVKFIVAFCWENGVISIAEGVETKEALEVLKQLGVSAGQGYYLYHPTKLINMPHMLQAVKAL